MLEHVELDCLLQPESEPNQVAPWSAPEWQGPFFEQLAEVCQAAALTILEARAVNCSARGLSLLESGRVLGMAGSAVHIRKAMWANLHRASGRLAAFVYANRPPHDPDRQRSTSSNAFLWEVLDCMRSFVSNPRPVTYDERGTPVTVRGRLVIPDDLKRPERPPATWLDDLCLTIQARLSEDREHDQREHRRGGERWAA